jgi:exopolysaccharide transport family protein
MNGLRQLPSEEYYQLPPPGYPYPPFQEEKEVHLRDYWRVIWKRRWMIVAVFLVVLIFTVVKTITTKPVYRGTATIQINIENPQIVDFKEIFTVNMWAMDYYQTQYRILESRNLARRVVHKLRLSEHPEFLPGSPSAFQRLKSGILSPVRSVFRFIKSWTTSTKSASPDQAAEPDPVVSETERDAPYVGALLARLRIDPIKESRLVRIHFESFHPDLAGQVPNVLAEEYIQLSMDSRSTTTEQAKEWLAKQLEEMKGKVEKAEEALQAFGSKNDIISLDEKDNVTLRRLGELNDALAKAEADRMAKEALYKQVRQEKGLTSDAIPAVLENKLIQELKQNYIQLEAQYMRLSETFKPSHPEMIRLKNQMDTTQKRLALEIGKVVASIKNEYEASLRNESLLRAAFDQQRGRTLEMQQKSIQYNILKREADTNKDLYKSLLQRMKEVGVTAGYNASNIQLVDRAETPRGPYMPDRHRNILLAAVIGLFLGVGLAFFLEHLDNTVKTPDDVEQLLRLPSFGMVPAISCERKKDRLSMRTSHTSGKSYPVEMITFYSPRSLLSEAYRNIRTSILLSFSEQPPKKIAVTSPNPLEGKTTTLVNTAISLSQTGARVLIVDGDMRKPRIHKVFGNGSGMGLSNFLSGNAKLWSVIRRSEIPNVYYIPAGSIPPNPAELLGSNLFRDMIQALSERFDHILIDAPPVVGFADSAVLSSVVDGVILVVSGGRTPKMALQRAKDALLQVNAKILGVVINRVNIHQADYNDYYYRYQYYYGEGAPKKELPYKSSGRETSSRRVSSSRRASSHR